jgi:uncharacterized protein (TIGR02117 family)
MTENNPPARRLFALALLLTVFLGCASAPKVADQDVGPPDVRHPFRLASHQETPNGPAVESDTRIIHIVGHGWHTGLVLPTRHISPKLLPEIDDFGATDFVEIGWGDEGFYRADRMSLPLILGAGFWPTKSVLHIAGFDGPVEEVFVASDIIEIEVTPKQFDRMCQFVGDTFSRAENGEALSLGEGAYGNNSVFYRAKGKYYFPKTCNVWTAKALDEAGLPVMPAFAATAENVLFQSRRIGRVVRESGKGMKSAAFFGRE